MLAAIACKTERPKIARPRPIVLYVAGNVADGIIAQPLRCKPADKRYIACHDASSGLGQWAGNNATGGAQDIRTEDPRP